MKCKYCGAFVCFGWWFSASGSCLECAGERRRRRLLRDEEREQVERKLAKECSQKYWKQIDGNNRK